MNARSALKLGSSKSMGQRRVIPVIEISHIEDERIAWTQADPVAIIVVEEEGHYLLPISEEVTLDELRSEIPALDNRLKDERARLTS